MKKRVLMIDDDRVLSSVVTSSLEATGRYEVAYESDPCSAVAAARAFHPDLILLDLMMPGMDGGEVSSRLNRDPQLCRVPIIIVSAVIPNFDKSESGTDEFHGHLMLEKPLRLEQLVDCIDDELALAR